MHGPEVVPYLVAISFQCLCIYELTVHHLVERRDSNAIRVVEGNRALRTQWRTCVVEHIAVKLNSGAVSVRHEMAIRIVCTVRKR